MNSAQVIAKLSMIFTKEDMERVHASVGQNGEEIIFADVHGFHAGRARRFLKNIIAMMRKAFELVVIHGFNNGTVLKDMIREDFKSLQIETDECNEGRTIMYIQGC